MYVLLSSLIPLMRHEFLNLGKFFQILFAISTKYKYRGFEFQNT